MPALFNYTKFRASCGKVHYPQSVTVLFYKFFKILCSVLGCGIHYNGSFVASSQQFFDKFEKRRAVEFFFPVESTGANPILHRKSPVSGDLRNKSEILFGLRVTMGRALGHGPAAALSRPAYTAQNRPVLRTKSAVSGIFATLLSLRRLPCFCAWNSGTFGVKL